MTTLSRIFPSFYRDSVSLMQLSARLAALPGIEQASAVMATAANLALLADTGLGCEGLTPSPNDLVVVVRGPEPAPLEAGLDAAKAALEAKPVERMGTAAAEPSRSIAMALSQAPDINLALISTPGEYAAAEARKALQLGLHVMSFSDNVALEDEIALKRLAHSRDRLMMGPDCGTAILDGVPLGFANVVRRGAIGCIGASGTGLQEITCQIDRLGGGISQAIGTGGRDLKAAVGGMTMLQGLGVLAADPETRVIVLVSKPPAPDVAESIRTAAARTGKPVVVNFIGATADAPQHDGLHVARTLEDAARLAVALASDTSPAATPAATAVAKPAGPLPEIARFRSGQRFVRGLFSGGTFCYEALVLLTEALERPVYSNTPLDHASALADVWTSREHTAVDLGDDLFTRGRPHPMIDHRLRNERIVAEAADPDVAVILLDVVLGHGAHPDPAETMRPAIRAARETAALGGRDLAFVASVCGTANDPQDLSRQSAALHDAGVLLADSNAAAARLAAAIVRRIDRQGRHTVEESRHAG